MCCKFLILVSFLAETLDTKNGVMSLFVGGASDWRSRRVTRRRGLSSYWSPLHPYNADGSIVRHSLPEAILFFLYMEIKVVNSEGVNETKRYDTIPMKHAIVGMRMALENECENCSIAYNARIDYLLIVERQRITGARRVELLLLKEQLKLALFRWRDHAIGMSVRNVHVLNVLGKVMNVLQEGMILVS